MDISNGTRMSWLMKKNEYKKSRETVPLNETQQSAMYFLEKVTFSLKNATFVLKNVTFSPKRMYLFHEKNLTSSRISNSL